MKVRDIKISWWRSGEPGFARWQIVDKHYGRYFYGFRAFGLNVEIRFYSRVDIRATGRRV